MKFISTAVMSIVVLLSGCNTMYTEATIDPKTGLYEASGEVSPGGVKASKTPVSLGDFKAVVISANSNLYPVRLEFVLRRTLNDLGYREVVNQQEFRAWASDQKIELPEVLSQADFRNFSATVAPVLVVQINYLATGSPNQGAGLVVRDGRTGEPLLVVQHSTVVWSNTDREVIYPVLNELRIWDRSVRHQNT